MSSEKTVSSGCLYRDEISGLSNFHCQLSKRNVTSVYETWDSVFERSSDDIRTNLGK